MLKDFGSIPQFTAVSAAQFTAADGSAAALADTPLANVGLAALQADPDNSGTIKLGGAAGQYVVLEAGDWFPFLVPLDNLSALHAIGSAAGQKINAIIFK